MAVKYKEHATLPVFEVEVEGKITQADMDAILPPLEAFIQRHGQVRMVEVIPTFTGFEWSTIWAGIKFDVAHIRDIQRVAVVTDVGWIGGFTRALCRVSPLEIQVFDMAEIEAARRWAEAS
jgi:hypothetical protein